VASREEVVRPLEILMPEGYKLFDVEVGPTRTLVFLDCPTGRDTLLVHTTSYPETEEILTRTMKLLKEHRAK